VASESPRITELRRRVENDPSSIAFAQLAEEYRRAGDYDAAERYCRSGLARHPAYLSARVTLGRTLIELNKLDEAEMELQHVLTAAPDNLAAIRGLAEIQQRLGRLDAALEYYRRALELSRHDPDLEETVERLARIVSSASAPPAPVSTSDGPTDFDALLDSLGIRNHPAPPSVEALLSAPETTAAAIGSSGSLEHPIEGDAPALEPGQEPLPDLAPHAADVEDMPLTAEASPTAPEAEELRQPDALEAFDEEPLRARNETVDETVAEPVASAPPGLERERLILDELEAWLKALGR
jgi:tetratricopeptide (TPR) repeat protein